MRYLPRFQLHLSTCTVLMFAAGGLLWLNLKVDKRFAIKPLPQYHGDETLELSMTRSARSGWPFTMSFGGDWIGHWIPVRHKNYLRAALPKLEPVFSLNDLRKQVPSVYEEVVELADSGALEWIGLSRDNRGRPRTDDDMIAPEMYFNYLNLTANVLITLAILVLITIACEWLLRRRVRKHTTTPL